jgi:DnaJ-class molecular chaperone
MTDSIKIRIRKRLFIAAEARGEAGSEYRVKWCSYCQGRGVVCVEQIGKDGFAFAAMETCTTCNGEKVTEVE